MKFLRFSVLILLLVVPGQAELSDSQAQQKAVTLWGAAAHIQKDKSYFDVGCLISGQFVIAGHAKRSWDAAFLAVNLQTNGPHVVTAVARDVAGNTATSDPVTVYICNPMP